MGNNSGNIGGSNISSEEKLQALLGGATGEEITINENQKLGDEEYSREDSDLAHIYEKHLTDTEMIGDSYDEDTFNSIMESVTNTVENNDYFKSLEDYQQDIIRSALTSEESIGTAMGVLSSEGAVYYDDYDSTYGGIHGDESLTFMTTTTESINSEPINRALKRIVDNY